MKRNNKRSIYFMVIFGLAIFIGVGYAFLAQALNVIGNTIINKASWDIHFENLRVTDGSVTSTSPAEIDANKTTVNFGVTLTNPGDYYEFSVDEVNKGTIDAMVSSIVKTGVTEEQAKYLDYSVTYDSGAVISEKQLLPAGGKETVKVKVEFKKDITAADLPTEEVSINLSFGLEYVQADDSKVTIVHPVCKRATTLHTEICNQSSNYCAGSGYAVGDTITYGNLGTTGTLVSGDAFDCDVNGDGIYDSEKERFYYVLDLDTNNDYAVLVYYNNVSGGVADNLTGISYVSSTDYTAAGGNEEDYGKGNWNLGPLTAIKALPTISQWSNVSLSNTARDIKDGKGVVKISKFSYTGYAARLLSVQEIEASCNLKVENLIKNSLTSCKYLLENTMYSNSNLKMQYFIENVQTDYSYTAYVVYSTYAAVLWDYAGNYGRNGIRPVIEVEKSKIDY